MARIDKRVPASVAFGRRVRELRVLTDLTQEDVANRLGLDQSSYARIERGDLRRGVTLDQAERIAEILGHPLRYLIGDPGMTPAELAIRDALLIAQAELDGYLRELADLEAREADITARRQIVKRHAEGARRRLDDLQKQVRQLDEKAGR